MAATATSAGKATRRREEILSAFLVEAADYGFDRISMESIAKRVGLSRAQLYKYFESRDELAETALTAELARILELIGSTMAAHDKARAAVVAGVTEAMEVLRTHPIVLRLLRTEHDLMMRHLLGDRPTLLMAKAWITSEFTALAERTKTPFEAEESAEFVLRFIVSLLTSQHLGTDIALPGEVEARCRRWLLPGIFAPRS